jgi:predicted NAD-dependent protein-ADP-ribosyltransferase YbiA (DUF1768 family)
MDTDPALAERIRRLPTARMAQQQARQQAHRQRTDWLDVNVSIMDKVLERKFSQHRALRHMLRSTGSRELIEDSPVRGPLEFKHPRLSMSIDRLVLGDWE